MFWGAYYMQNTCCSRHRGTLTGHHDVWEVLPLTPSNILQSGRGLIGCAE